MIIGHARSSCHNKVININCIYREMQILEGVSFMVLGYYFTDFPGGSDGKASTYNVGKQGSIPGLGRSPGEGNAPHSSILA